MKIDKKVWIVGGITLALILGVVFTSTAASKNEDGTEGDYTDTDEVNGSPEGYGKVYTNFDAAWDYQRKKGGGWLTHKKVWDSSRWVDISDNDVAVNKLNDRYGSE